MFQKISELLEAGKISQEAANELDAEVSKELKKLRDENASWRTKYNELSQNVEAVTKTKDELEEKLKSIDERIKKAKEEGKAELVSELEAQKTEQEQLKANLEAIQSENKKLKLQTALQKELSKYDVLDRDVVFDSLSLRVEVADDGVKFKDGDTVLPLEDGVKKFFETKPNLLKAQGGSGSGAGGSGAGHTDKKYSEMTATERVELYKKDPALYEKLKQQG